MALIPEWDAFGPGIVFGCLGLLLALITLLVWRRMEHKTPGPYIRKAYPDDPCRHYRNACIWCGHVFLLVWENMAVGIAIGLAGILILLGLIPLTRGIKE